jgi:hypothetical protein
MTNKKNTIKERLRRTITGLTISALFFSGCGFKYHESGLEKQIQGSAIHSQYSPKQYSLKGKVVRTEKGGYEFRPSLEDAPTSKLGYALTNEQGYALTNEQGYGQRFPPENKRALVKPKPKSGFKKFIKYVVIGFVAGEIAKKYLDKGIGQETPSNQSSGSDKKGPAPVEDW